VDTHWEQKRKWIAEAKTAGGFGEIFCTGEFVRDQFCDTYLKSGFGGMECRGCSEAVRFWPDGRMEHWRDREDGIYDREEGPDISRSDV
jgi:hypothetical protein